MIDPERDSLLSFRGANFPLSPLSMALKEESTIHYCVARWVSHYGHWVWCICPPYIYTYYRLVANSNCIKLKVKIHKNNNCSKLRIHDLFGWHSDRRLRLSQPDLNEQIRHIKLFVFFSWPSYEFPWPSDYRRVEKRNSDNRKPFVSLHFNGRHFFDLSPSSNTCCALECYWNRQRKLDSQETAF